MRVPQDGTVQEPHRSAARLSSVEAGGVLDHQSGGV